MKKKRTDDNCSSFEAGLGLIFLGAFTLVMWLMLSYYDVPEWFERDGVRVAFAIWKWLAIAEMGLGVFCLIEEGRQKLAGETRKPSIRTTARYRMEEFGTAWEMASVQTVLLFFGVLIFSHWAWFAGAFVLSTVIAFRLSDSATPDVGVYREDEKKKGGAS